MFSTKVSEFPEETLSGTLRHLDYQVVNNLSQALLRLEAKDGDVVFFDLGAISVEELAKVCSSPEINHRLPGVTFIGICVRHGQSVEDAVFAMSKTELDLLIADKGNDN